MEAHIVSDKQEIHRQESPEKTIVYSDDVDFDLQAPHPLIPDGRYEVIYVRHEKRRFFSKEKYYVWFKICQPGLYIGVHLFKAFNGYEKPWPRGCELNKVLMLLYGSRVRKNICLNLQLFKNKVLEVTVVTVKKDRRQNDLPMHLQYSKIDAILSVIAGSDGYNV